MDEKEPMNQVFHTQLRILSRKKDWEGVEELCNENQKILSESEGLLWLRSLFMNQNYDLCYTISQKITNNNPKNIDALRFMARSATKIPLENMLIQSSWEALLDEIPEDPESMNNFSRTLIIENNLKQAIEMVDRLLSLETLYGPVLTTIVKLAESARESEDYGIETKALGYLEELSTSNVKAAILLSRHLLYFSEDERLVTSFVKNIHSIHGKEILAPLLTFILKSEKIEVISKAGLASNINELLDPISGNLSEKIGLEESIDFHRKLEGKIKRLLSKNRSEIPTKFSPRHLQLLYGQQSEKKSLDSSIENILERIEPHCFDLDEKRIIEGQLLFFSIPEIIDPRHYKFSNISVLSIESSFDSESISIYEEDGLVLSLRYQEKFVTDPRDILGRFISMVPEFTTPQRRKLALILVKISEYNPSKIFYSSNFPEALVACKILGYSGEMVSLVGENEVNYAHYSDFTN